ncbi:hypothetical protein [Sphingomonas sp.]|uniref:hypothetical protein n=1 Tax=Sphingomonas sp. TaxID=28214 RepID=UPI003AFFDFB8
MALVTVDRAIRLKGDDAINVAAGRVRFYLAGTVDTLLAGRGGLPGGVDWIADVPLDGSNHLPKLKKRRLILFARTTPGRPGTLQLVARDSAIDWTPDSEARLRAILTEAVSPNAPPPVTGIGHAFHVAGTIPGEGETQIFLRTADARPVSLSIVRRPGEQPRWSESLGELVDDAAAAPKRETLAWYRLACGLPPTLPDEAVADQSPEDADQARTDYRFVLESLGSCDRAGTDQAAPPLDQSSR